MNKYIQPAICLWINLHTTIFFLPSSLYLLIFFFVVFFFSPSSPFKLQDRTLTNSRASKSAYVVQKRGSTDYKAKKVMRCSVGCQPRAILLPQPLKQQRKEKEREKKSNKMTCNIYHFVFFLSPSFYCHGNLLCSHLNVLFYFFFPLFSLLSSWYYTCLSR